MARRVRSDSEDILGAIDVGTNAVRLELARVLPDGMLETLHTERDPVRPGEGLFTSGVIAKPVADRLLATLTRYAALCRRSHARVRAVATSAVREAQNKDEIVRRAREEAGLTLDVVSGREEARLICLGVLRGKPASTRSLCIDIGGGSTEVILAQGEEPRALWSVALGSVRVTELFGLGDRVGRKQVALMRSFAREMISEAIPQPVVGAPSAALGSSGTIGAIVGFARAEGLGHATVLEISRAVEALSDLNLERRRRRFDPRRADIVVAGAIVLESVMRQLKVKTITPVDRGLREGILQDLVRRRRADATDPSLAEAAIAMGARLGFSEPHARQVAKLSMTLFDALAPLHGLPVAARPWLEVAALLHDVGRAVNYQRHHKHTYYLIHNADLPGLTDHERALVATIARFHRRSKPDPQHELMQPFSAAEVRVIRRCATLLRLADSLDRSHHQAVQSLSAAVRGSAVVLSVRSKQPLELELWALEREVALFREVFGKSLVVAQPTASVSR